MNQPKFFIIESKDQDKALNCVAYCNNEAEARAAANELFNRTSGPTTRVSKDATNDFFSHGSNASCREAQIGFDIENIVTKDSGHTEFDLILHSGERLRRNPIKPGYAI